MREENQKMIKKREGSNEILSYNETLNCIWISQIFLKGFLKNIEKHHSHWSQASFKAMPDVVGIFEAHIKNKNDATKSLEP